MSAEIQSSAFVTPVTEFMGFTQFPLSCFLCAQSILSMVVRFGCDVVECVTEGRTSKEKPREPGELCDTKGGSPYPLLSFGCSQTDADIAPSLFLSVDRSLTITHMGA